MIPNCEGCKHEFQTAIDYFNQGYDIALDNFGKGSKGKHLFIAVFDKNGKLILY
jgi:hypothetical protein